MDKELYIQKTKIFKAFSDCNRLMIIDMLSCGEMCACNLIEKLDITQPTLSHHMRILCESGLVKVRKEGKWMYYTLNMKTVEKFRQFVQDITSETTGCICKELTPKYEELTSYRSSQETKK